MNPPRSYAAIDLKSFYASVECHERGLDPLTTDLVVADPSRTDKTICLAISPSLKAKYQLPGRARLFEVNAKAGAGNFIIAPPRMQYYLDYSQRIYNIYLQFIAPEDIFPYSVDEVFCDLTSYLKFSHCTSAEFTREMIRAVFQATGITATAGIGTNLFLAKVAMDIVAKHAAPDQFGTRLAELDELSFREQLWAHQPITDFWRIGPGTARRLKDRQMFTLGDVARCSLINPELLYALFGVNAEILIDHAWGIEPITISAVKNYQPERRSLSSGQVLSRPYNFSEARTIVKEMAISLALDLAEKQWQTDHLVLFIEYDHENTTKPELSFESKLDRHGRQVPRPARGTIRLAPTANIKSIREHFLKLYDKIANPALTIRKLTLDAGACSTRPEDLLTKSPKLQQTNLFTKPATSNISINTNADTKLESALLKIRHRYGKNAILSGSDFEDGATGRARHQQIGGHHA